VDFQYQSYKFFIYVYLDPFQEFPTAYKVKAGNPLVEYCFAFAPIYLGKGTGAGYRQNQHLKAFLNKKENNPEKIKAFQKIQDGMADAVAIGDHTVPWNWDEYKSGYIKILEVFQDPKELIDFEMQMIKGLGTQWDNTGYLSNKIKNAYKFDGLSQGRVDPF
jgi:hypothetical protein